MLGTFARMRSVVVEMLLVVSKMWSTTIDKMRWAVGNMLWAVSSMLLGVGKMLLLASK